MTVTVEKAVPTVSDVYPANGATGAVRNTDFAASFSEPMDPATFTTSTVTLVKEGTTTPISVRVGYYESNGYYKVWLSPPYDQGFYLDANTKASSINGTTFKLFRKGSTTKLAATVSYPDLNSPAKLDPRDSLRSGVTYKAVVTTGAKDLAGNSLAQQKAWFFKVR